MTDIKAHPSCSGANSRIDTTNGAHQVVCTSCGMRGPYCMLKGEAVIVWNAMVSNLNEKLKPVGDE